MEKERWKEKAKIIVNSMALAGYNSFYADSPADLSDDKIEAVIWRRVARDMLKIIKHPAELYQICHAIACMNDNELEVLERGGVDECR